MASMKRSFLAVSLIAQALFATAPAVAGGLCEFEDIVVLGINSVHVSRDAKVTGDVIANTESPGPVLNDSAEVALDKNAIVSGDVKGHSIHLDIGASIVGATTCVEPLGELGSCVNSAPPPYTDMPAFHNAVVRAVPAAGNRCSVSQDLLCVVNGDCPSGETCEAPPQGIGEDVTVGPGEEVTLPAGDYGDIVIDGSKTEPPVLNFLGGLYNIRSLTAIKTTSGKCTAAEPCRSVEFAEATDLRVAGRWDSSSESLVGPGSGSTISAGDIVIYVAGTNLGSGPLGSPFAVNIGRNSTVDANFYAANGTIEIDQGSIATGAFLGLDVEIQKNVDVFRDSAFVNQPPTAFAQEVQTDGASALVITLEGLDPEGGDLDFSIEVNPAEGALGAITPIVPATVNLCSQSGEACLVNSDCPGFAEGESCETIQPPVTQAEVTYTPDSNNCVTEPESGEVECPPDFFTFGVTDDCGALGTAIVSVNGGTDEEPGDPVPGDNVTAFNQELATTVNQFLTITLEAEAPQTVTALSFRVETLPSGVLWDSLGATVQVGGELPSPVLTYQAPAVDGSDSFTFSARDSSTSIPPCGPPSCDTGTVNIGIGEPLELAPNQSVSTNLNTPVEITLFANAGGTGDGGSQPITSFVTEVTYGDNGPPPSRETLSRLEARANGGTGWAASQFPLTALGVDQGWQQFSWCDEATAGTSNVCSISGGACQIDADCPGWEQGETCNEVSNCFTGALVDLVNESPVIEGPFEFTISEPSCLRVTDTLAKGDHWRVENVVDGTLDWTDRTSEVAQSTVGTTSNPSVAFGDSSYSHGAFDLGGDCKDASGQQIACDHAINLVTIPPDSFVWGTAAYLRVDTGPCIDLVWTITSLPANGILKNLDGSFVQVGDTYLGTPTLVYTPLYNVSGPDQFSYSVTEGGTLGQNLVVDSALVDLLVNSTDPCVINGRDPGCIPGGSVDFQLTEEGSTEESESKVIGPTLSVAVGGPGDVSSSRRWLGSEARGILVCGGGSVCSASFEKGSTVMLYARPVGSDSEFVEWGGDCRGSEPATAITLSVEARCTALFREKAE